MIASVEQEPLLMHDVPLACVLGGEYLMMRSGYGLVAFDGASLQWSAGLVASVGAFLWRSDELELGASGEASPQKSNEAGALCPDDSDKCPQKIDLVGQGELLTVATAGAGVAMELNVIAVGGDDYEPVVTDSS